MKAAAVTMIALWVGGLDVHPVRAQQQDPGDGQSAVVRFETGIVVTPERGETPRDEVPASTAVLEGSAVPALPAAVPGEVFSFLPGFRLARAELHAGRPVVSARGFFGGGEAEYVQLLVDGVPMSDAESGLIDLSAIAVSSIGRVEGLRGPGASLYGDSAIGGVVQILTAGRPSGGVVTALAGSLGTLVADGTYGARAGAASVTVSGAVRRTDGGSTGARQREILAAGSADGRAGGLAWRWTATGVTRDGADPGPLSRQDFSRAPYVGDPMYALDGTNRQDFTSAFGVRRVDGAWRSQARAYGRVRSERRTRTIPLAPGIGDRRRRDLSTTVVGGSVEAGRVLALAGRPRLRAGVDLSREALDGGYRPVDGHGAIGRMEVRGSGRRLRLGAFGSASWSPQTRLRLTGAMRWDGVGDAGFDVADGAEGRPQRAWSPRAGVTLQLTDAGTVTAFGQVARAFKVPTVDQRYDPRPYPDFSGGTLTLSNPRLIPERATNVEAGLSGVGPIRWSALAYRLAVDDEIDFDARTFRYTNIGRSRHTGLELELEVHRWARVIPSLSYAFTRVVDQQRDRQLKNVPRHALAVDTRLELPLRLGAYVRYRHDWGAFLDDENRYPLAGASTADLRVRRRAGRLMIFVDALHLAGHPYEEYGFTLVDGAGRTRPYVYPSAPRLVRVGLTLDF